MEEFIAENVKLEEISFKDFQWEKVRIPFLNMKTLCITGYRLTKAVLLPFLNIIYLI